jgi:archaeal type IV pilus assembly protein PilA
MNNFKRFMKNRKAISPIFATLILIAIAVIAGVVVYMFTSGTLATMTNGGTAGQEKLTVQGASGTTGTVTVYVQQTSGPTASVNGLIIKSQSGNTVASATVTPTTLASGVLTTISGTMSPAIGAGTYTVTVTTAAGGSFVSPQFVVP